VGAIDQPIQRERHTGFPIIPASSLKGSFADHWNHELTDGKRAASTPAWLFGSDDANAASAGALLFSEARLLAFPIRSAKGSYAWITCPLMLQRAKRDGVLSGELPPEPKDDQAIFAPDGPLDLGGKIVLEDYCFTASSPYPAPLAEHLATLIPDDELLATIRQRLVVLSNGMMTHFASTACELAQHVRISDETGTAEGTGLFNQENVPADTLFYSLIHATKGRSQHFEGKSPNDALAEFEAKLIAAHQIFQFGGDASTGLGFCTVTLAQ
jgi:CRISPR-associated protein Cmr4